MIYAVRKAKPLAPTGPREEV